MLVSEIATRVKRQFGDEAGAQITDADIIRWTNDAQREIALHNDLLQATGTTALLANQDQYTLPADVLNLQALKIGTRRLTFMTKEDAFQRDDNAPGDPQYYSVFGTKLDLYPTPIKAETMTIYYTRRPVEITLITAEPELPVQYHNRIVEYCLAQAYELDADWDSYKQKMGMFQEGVDRLKANNDWQPQSVYPSITVSHDDMDPGGSFFYG